MANNQGQLQTKQQILDAALDQFARRGLEATSVQDIAMCANVECKTVFRHFGNKMQLYVVVFELAADRLLDALGAHLESQRATLSETLRHSVRTLSRGNLAALICAANSGPKHPAVVQVLASLNRRLAEFWQRRLDAESAAPELLQLPNGRLASLIVPAAVAFAAGRDDEPSGKDKSGLIQAFAAALERIVMNGEGSRMDGANRAGVAIHQPLPDALEQTVRVDPVPLSRRELQVLVEVDKGASNREIAYGLDVTEHTVKYHLKNAYRKLSVRRRTEALKVAKELGLIRR
ncbi:MAG: LuxR C-terminal-related transcriptional regulator [Gammaproteobacteria bacterium]|nr:LuxR C-terminal-related transcriptional regulator [Gammaproteobacteria bacterium]